MEDHCNWALIEKERGLFRGNIGGNTSSSIRKTMIKMNEIVGLIAKY